MRLFVRVSSLAALLGFVSCAATPAAQPMPAAGAAKTDLAAPRQQAFVIAANPLAARAGLDILKRGGSAVDAAVAVQAMLSLVEPQSSGLGGGAFMNFYDARTRKLTIYDGRETAPAQAVSTMFLDGDGKPVPFGEAVLSGRATGVPGAVAMLARAHRERGRLPWRNLFGESERTADQGFIVSPRLARMVRGKFPQNGAPDVIAYFSRPDGTRVAAGDRLRNPAYADFLRRLAAQGPSAMYGGSTRRAARRGCAP